MVTKELLGKFLVRKVGVKEISGMITEVEAYIGPEDQASHASRGRTPRTEVMYGKPGYWYVYLIYGMHYCLNIVTEKKEYPAAILIRGIKINQKEPKGFTPLEIRRLGRLPQSGSLMGPGRVCKYFQIDKNFNAKKVSKVAGLCIEDRGVVVPSRRIRKSPRIGVDYAGKWKEKKWRFFMNIV